MFRVLSSPTCRFVDKAGTAAASGCCFLLQSDVGFQEADVDEDIGDQGVVNRFKSHSCSLTIAQFVAPCSASPVATALIDVAKMESGSSRSPLITSPAVNRV